MESDVTQPALADRLWVWGDAHKKQLIIGLLALLAVGLVVAGVVTYRNSQQNSANDALSKLTARSITPNVPPPTADALLKVGRDYSGTDAGQRALLLAAAETFDEGKYDEARAQFQQFMQEHGDSPFLGEAALGVAATMDAQGRTNDAINAYRVVTDHYPQNWNVAPQAKMALARLYQGTGKLEDARQQLMEALRTYPGESGQEANLRLRQLFTEHPELIPTNPTPSSASVLERPRPPVPAAPTAPNLPAAAPMVRTTNGPTPLPPLRVPGTNKP